MWSTSLETVQSSAECRPVTISSEQSQQQTPVTISSLDSETCVIMLTIIVEEGSLVRVELGLDPDYMYMY